MKRTVKPIETVEEFADAKLRMAALDASMPGSSEEEELASLIAVSDKWKHDHGEMPKSIMPIFKPRNPITEMFDRLANAEKK